VSSPPARRPDDPVLAIASPPRVDHLLALAGLAPDTRLEANFSGWSKLALLADDRVLLVPRDHGEVESLRREERALRALDGAGLELVPRVLSWHEENRAIRLPLLVITRLPGTSLEPLEPTIALDDLAHVLTQVGRAAARWHALDPDLVPERDRRRTEHRHDLDGLLGRTDDHPAVAAAGVADLLGLVDDDIDRCAAAIERNRSMPDFLVHSDLHAGQMLIDPDTLELTGILDWQGARRDHPFVDVDLGEWSTAMWQRHRDDFERLRRAFWDGHRESSDVSDDDVLRCEWVWSVAHALSFERLRVGGEDREHVVGTRDEALAAARRATGHLPR
jgi:Ser/Thr protein kinase RdoA (MazF antagonist)